MHCQHPKMSKHGGCDPGSSCSIKQCHENVTLLWNKCGEAVCKEYEEIMIIVMMEGMIHRTNEGYFKTGRDLSEGPLRVQMAQEMKKGRQEERRGRKRR
jgi:hypothetical protein